MPKITNANDMYVSVAGIAPLPAEDFDLTVSQEKSLVHGAGRDEPRGHSVGNIEYEWEFTLEGEDAEFFNETAKDKTFRITLRGQDYKWTLGIATTIDRNFSGTDGEVVEYSANGIGYQEDEERL